MKKVAAEVQSKEKKFSSIEKSNQNIGAKLELEKNARAVSEEVSQLRKSLQIYCILSVSRKNAQQIPRPCPCAESVVNLTKVFLCASGRSRSTKLIHKK